MLCFKYQALKGVDYMNYAEIERLKLTLTNFTRRGCGIRLPAYGVEGRVVGIGFKPYWTNPVDSKIDKLELNIMDNYGRVVPFNFNYVTGYDVLSQDGRQFEDSKSVSLDILVYSPDKARQEDSSQKVRLEITVEPMK